MDFMDRRRRRSGRHDVLSDSAPEQGGCLQSSPSVSGAVRGLPGSRALYSGHGTGKAWSYVTFCRHCLLCLCARRKPSVRACRIPRWERGELRGKKGRRAEVKAQEVGGGLRPGGLLCTPLFRSGPSLLGPCPIRVRSWVVRCSRATERWAWTRAIRSSRGVL